MSLFRRKEKGKVLRTETLGLHWDTESPFLFASHHNDDYPPGNAQQAPPLSEIGGRNLGRDYKKIYGFRMYNGKVVPGFPLHAHWGYETVTIAEKGYVDHFDCKGNQGRYGFGDVQWLTAGRRYQHNEMYPLASSDGRNPVDITQIMINLPLKDKDSEPEFRMMWAEDIPVVRKDGFTVKVYAGEYDGVKALPPSDVSWAKDPDHHVRILRVAMEPGAEFELPAISDTMGRNVYLTECGSTFSVDGEQFELARRFKLPGDETIVLTNGDSDAVFWLLEGEPIEERQIQYGPVVLANDKEVRNAINIIRIREFKDWPWDVIDKAQPKGTGRFVKYADGREEHR